MVFLFNKHESPKDALCTVWLKLAEWFWRRRFLNFISVFLLSHYYLPLEKGGPLRLKKLESSSPKYALCEVLLKLAQWLWRRRQKCEKFTTTTDKSHLSHWLRWAKDHLACAYSINFEEGVLIETIYFSWVRSVK